MISYVTQDGFIEIRGLSTDVKPTTKIDSITSVENGAAFLEMDTGKVFFFNGATKTWSEPN